MSVHLETALLFRLLAKELPATYLPKVGSSETDVTNFSDRYLKEAAIDSFVPKSQLDLVGVAAQLEFHEWSFQQRAAILEDQKDASDEE